MSFTDPVHVMCAYMNENKCKGCPAEFTDERYGKMQQACYGIAMETISVAVRGGPFNNDEANKRWRGRLRLVGQPRLVK